MLYKSLTYLLTYNIGNIVEGEHPKFAWNRGGVAVLNRKPAISLKLGKIAPRRIFNSLDDALSTGTKISDRDWPFCVKLRFAPACLEL